MHLPAVSPSRFHLDSTCNLLLDGLHCREADVEELLEEVSKEAEEAWNEKERLRREAEEAAERARVAAEKARIAAIVSASTAKIEALVAQAKAKTIDEVRLPVLSAHRRSWLS